MISLDLFLLSLGCILFLGLLTSAIGENTALPRVTLLLCLGLILGPELTDVLPRVFSIHFEPIASITLMMVGFLLGGKLNKNLLMCSPKSVILISLSAALATTFCVVLGLMWLGVDTKLSILLAAISAATAPAAIVDVVNESHVDNIFTQSLLSIVALDDVWALMLFALALATVSSSSGFISDFSFFYQPALEVLGAIGLGGALGVPTAYLSGRIHRGQPMILEALGAVFICGGLSLWLDVSYLIASIVMGAVVANLAKHHERPFHAIKDIESVFLVVFFVTAGASLKLDSLMSVGFIGAAFIVLRCVGKYIGAWLGSSISNAQESVAHWMRYALLPQAGVSIGMALVASAHFPDYQQSLLTLVIGSTVFFEVVGPVFTKFAIQRATEESTNIDNE